jgi:hypothetical protein
MFFFQFQRLHLLQWMLPCCRYYCQPVLTLFMLIPYESLMHGPCSVIIVIILIDKKIKESLRHISKLFLFEAIERLKMKRL